MKSILEEAAACRAAFADSKVGDLAWNIHHDSLCEHLTEPAEERIKYILTQKAKGEQACRLHNMRPVRGKLPVKSDAVRVKWRAACAKSDAVRAEWRAACAKWDAARAEWRAACAKWDAACDEWVAVRAEWVSACALPEMRALHAKEVPDSTWNGKSIFPE